MESDDVFLVRTPGAWGGYPKTIRSALLEGIDRIARLRADIARSAKVRTMPRVRGFDEIWTRPNGEVVLGRAGVMSAREGYVPVADLPALTLICPDDAVTRGTLVHEFSHLFQVMTFSLDGLDSGKPDPGIDTDDVFSDESYEAQMHCDLRDWFGEEDAAELMGWNHPRTLCIRKRALELGLNNHLRYKVPNVQGPSGTLFIPAEVAAHIRYLRSRTGS